MDTAFLCLARWVKAPARPAKTFSLFCNKTIALFFVVAAVHQHTVSSFIGLSVATMVTPKKLKQTRLAPLKKKKKPKEPWKVDRAARRAVADTDLSSGALCRLLDYFAEGFTLIMVEMLRKDRSARVDPETASRAVHKTFEECGYTTNRLNNCLFESLIMEQHIDSEELASSMAPAVARLIGGLDSSGAREDGLEALKNRMEAIVSRRLQADHILAYSIIQFYEFPET
jgi:hypothetical protein